ncbi:hypothetical protein EBE87_23425 [Pseudoroseomonas wenyumeiae]|uniref:ParB/Sulfiredoxin domain-containing protein n=1 Tax=Teichococcus wenyumeiae TaxID=2478470 RepID=A0A3A9JFJ6_9PROT|nr:hypothetical protein D6Z83_19900 [Pseudoroseomonas wenyumeiae]RMI17242.1 hypothetical protein EBE87_23425 [Pseudoroseomonas wenyumeiae]
MRITTLTPATARDLLRRAHPSRRRQEETVQSYALAMRDGFWVTNGLPVIISRTGVLLDGMQRLAACAESGIPLRTYLAENVADDAYHTIDQHRRRSLAALLKQDGHTRHHLLASLLQRLAEYDADALGRPHAGPSAWVRLTRMLSTCPEIEAALTASLARASSPLPEAARSTLIFMGRQSDPELTERLLDVLETPGQFPAHEPGLLLLQELQRDRAAASWERPLALAIKTLNAMLAGKRLRGLSWNNRATRGKPPEAFPCLLGYQGLTALAPSPEEGAAVPDGQHWQMEIIDSAVAKRYLAKGGQTRQPIPAHVQALASDIQRGRWMLNAQPICFSASGRLLNGMHRLLAVIAADGRIRTPVVRGLPEEAGPSYDTQPKRIAAAESLAGDFGDQGLATAMANLFWRYERRTDHTQYKRAGAAEIREILTQHPRLIELRSFARRMVEYGRSSVMGYGAYVMEREDPGTAEIFLKALSTGADLGQGHPILALRNTLQRLRREGASQPDQLATLLAGWRRYRSHPAAQQDRKRQASPQGSGTRRGG